MNCPKCGEYYPDINKYCPNCGCKNPTPKQKEEVVDVVQEEQAPQVETENLDLYPSWYKHPDAQKDEEQEQNDQPPEVPKTMDIQQFEQLRNKRQEEFFNKYQKNHEDKTNLYIRYWKKAFNFYGRSSRKEFWVPFLINQVIIMVISMILFMNIGLSYLGFDNPDTIAQDFETMVTSEDFDIEEFYDDYITYQSDLYSSDFIFSQDTPIMLLLVFMIGFTIATYLPDFAIILRRLHDSGKSSLFYLVCLIPVFGYLSLFVMMLLPSNKGRNKYGTNPNGDDEM